MRYDPARQLLHFGGRLWRSSHLCPACTLSFYVVCVVAVSLVCTMAVYDPLVRALSSLASIQGGSDDARPLRLQFELASMQADWSYMAESPRWGRASGGLVGVAGPSPSMS